MAAFLTGKTGFVNVDGVPQAFGKWKLGLKTNKVNIPTWLSPNFVFFLAGRFDGTITLEGPWYVGQATPVLGNTYVWSLGLAAGVSLTVTGFLESVDASNDVEGGPQLSMTVQQNAAFGLQID